MSAMPGFAAVTLELVPSVTISLHSTASAVMSLLLEDHVPVGATVMSLLLEDHVPVGATDMSLLVPVACTS